MSQTKTICFSNSCKVWGGGEKWHFSTALKLRERGYKVLGITHKNSELARRFEQNGIPQLSISMGNLGFLNIFKILAIKRFLQENRIQCIILGLPNDVKVCGPASRLAGLEKIIYRRGLAIPLKNSVSNRFFMRHVVTHIISNSRETSRTLLANNPDLFDAGKISILYNGIDTREYDQRPHEILVSRKENKVILGNAGRLCKQKGQKYLIDIAVLLKKEGIAFKLLIAGKGELESELKAYARQKSMEHEIQFLGFVENIKSFMESIDIFLLTSLWEGFGNVIAEAMLSARPVIGFNLSSNSELIRNEENGYLIEFPDTAQFAERTRQLALNKSKRQEMGQKGKAMIHRQFDVEKSLDQLEGLLNSKR